MISGRATWLACGTAIEADDERAVSSLYTYLFGRFFGIWLQDDDDRVGIIGRRDGARHIIEIAVMFGRNSRIRGDGTVAVSHSGCPEPQRAAAVGSID